MTNRVGAVIDVSPGNLLKTISSAKTWSNLEPSAAAHHSTLRNGRLQIATLIAMDF
jgi:hypothetical protein